MWLLFLIWCAACRRSQNFEDTEARSLEWGMADPIETRPSSPVLPYQIRSLQVRRYERN